MTKPRLMILGHARHGKDTAAEWLRTHKGYQFVSSSWFMAERVVFPAFKRMEGVACEVTFGVLEDTSRPMPVYHDVLQCYEDRGNWRSFWYDQIAAFNADDPSRLTRELFAAGNDCYVGLRNKRELLHGRLSKAYDLAIWIDASDRCPPEDKSSCTVEPWMADVIVDNNGGLDTLDRNMEILYNKWIRPLEWKLDYHTPRSLA